MARFRSKDTNWLKSSLCEVSQDNFQLTHQNSRVEKF